MFLFYKIVGLLAAVTGQELQQKKTCIIRERGEKSQKIGIFANNELNFTISKFSKLFKNCFSHDIEAQLKVSLGKKNQKNKNIEKKIEAKNQPNFPRYQTSANRYWSLYGDRQNLVIGRAKLAV